ncbi:MAG TPA: TerB family tellurite resistance protein [Labilithrix sp.]|jgi:uncharacterized tellurite resistance protein B-like protein
MMDRNLDFGRILASGSLRDEEIDATLELAFLMAKADGDASFDELESFRALVKHLQPSASMTELLDGLDERLDAAESIEERARACAKKLGRPEAREAAYKAVYTIAVYDLETNEEERDLDDLLVEILDLDARVDDLEREVNEAL